MHENDMQEVYLDDTNELGNKDIQPVETMEKEIHDEIGYDSFTNPSSVSTVEKVEVKKQGFETKVSEYEYVNKNVVMTDNPRSTLPEDDKRIPVGLVTRTTKELEQLVDDPYFDAARDSFPEEYQNALGSGIELSQTTEVFSEALAKEGAEFRQYIPYEESLIRPYVPKWRGEHNESLTGVKAISRIRRALKLGSYLSFPCYASGVWVTLRAPTTFELADYYDLVSEELIELGKTTTGAIFSNTQIYLVKHLMDLAEKLLYGWSVTEEVAKQYSLRDILVVDDIETIAWAIGSSIYPNGYPFEEACTVDIEKCNFVIKQLVNLSKLFWVDKNKLTNRQIQHMSRHDARSTMDDIEKYRADSKWMGISECEFEDYGFKVILKTPTIAQHIESGYKWIGELESSVKEIAVNANNSRINKLVAERAGLSILRSYGHYVKSIIFNDGERINNVKDIEEAINAICNNTKAIEKLTDAVNKHITDSTVSMIAINRYKCPNCGEDCGHDVSEINPYLVPLNALRLFFNLRDRKLQLE